MKDLEGLMDELKEALQIDKHNLDQEVIMQATIWHRAAEQHARLEARRDECKLEIKEAHAELDKSLRARFDKDGEKYTEATLTHRITATDKMRALNRRYLELNLLANLWEVLKIGFNQKNDQLKNLVKLYSDSEFMTDSMGKEKGDATTRKADQVRNKVGELHRGRSKRARQEDD